MVYLPVFDFVVPFNIWSSEGIRGHAHLQEGLSVYMPRKPCGVETSPPPRLLGTTSAFFSWPSPLDSFRALPLNSIPLSMLPVYWLEFLHSFRPMVRSNILFCQSLSWMTLPSGYEVVYPHWHCCQQCQRPCYCWCYITIVSRQRL